MNGMLYVVFTMVAFVASVAGAICGIGGGVLIKPILDSFAVVDVAAVSFLSGCTVLSMSCYSVLKGKLSGESLVEVKTGTPLAIGAAAGEIAGKGMFQYLAGLFTDVNQVGAVQAFCLLAITFGTLIYTLNKTKIRTHKVNNTICCILIGLGLGICSSFLGIGGGPINLVVLFFFFSMDTKTAAQNSLYIIVFSQLTSLMSTLITGSIPDFSLLLLIVMVAGGILGGVTGRQINRQIDGKVVNLLFILLMVGIMAISAYNVWQFV